MHLQHKVVQLSSSDIKKIGSMILKTTEQDVKIALYEKWKVCTSVPLQNILSAHDCLPLLHMASNMVIDVSGNNMVAQFQVWYMYFPYLKHNKSFTDILIKILTWCLQDQQWNPQEYVEENYTYIIAILMFYENMKTETFKVLGYIIVSLLTNMFL